MKSYTTERLEIRLVTKEDAPFFLELYNAPHFIEHVGDRGLKTVQDAEKYIEEKFLPHIIEHGFGNFTIFLKETGLPIGAVGIFKREGIEVPDIGFSFLPDFEGKGYGFESASKLIDLAFTEFALKKLSAFTTDANISSQKLIEKLGLQYQETAILHGFTEELRFYLLEKK